MSILKRLSYFRSNPNTTEKDYKLYLLKARPLTSSETQEDRDKQIKQIKLC